MEKVVIILGFLAFMVHSNFLLEQCTVNLSWTSKCMSLLRGNVNGCCPEVCYSIYVSSQLDFMLI